MGEYNIIKKDMMLIRKIKTLTYFKNKHPPDEILLDTLIEMYKEEFIRRSTYDKL